MQVRDLHGGQLSDRSARSRGASRLELGPGAHGHQRQAGLQDAQPHQLLAQGGVAIEPSLAGGLDQAVGAVGRYPSGRARADGDPLVHQHGGSHAPAVVQVAEKVVGADAHVGEEHLVEVGAAVDLVDGADLHTLGVHGHDEHRDAGVLGNVRVGAGDDDPVGAQVGQRGPHLLAVDDPLVAVSLGPGLQAGHVGACSGLREHLAPHVLCGDDAGQVGRLLVVGAVLGHHGQAHPVGDEQVVGHVGVAAVLLAPHPVVGLGQPGAAVGGRVGQPGQTCGGQRLLESLRRPQPRFAPRVGSPAEVDAGGVLVEEGLAAGPERLVLFGGQDVVGHGRQRSGGRAGAVPARGLPDPVAPAAPPAVEDRPGWAGRVRASQAGIVRPAVRRAGVGSSGHREPNPRDRCPSPFPRGSAEPMRRPLRAGKEKNVPHLRPAGRTRVHMPRP